jgi:hypothetical protein
MKKITVKKQLIDFMIANGNDFRYTDVVKTILRINRGKDYVYTREDRGYYATNLCIHASPYSYKTGGYLVNGGGDCGLYKNESGRWSAKYFTKDEMLTNQIGKQVAKLVRQTQNAEFRYRQFINSGPDYSSYKRSQYVNDIDDAKEVAIKQIKKTLSKLA